MIDKQVAHQQAVRLQSLDVWLTSPYQAQVLEELTLAVMSASSEKIASFVIDEWIAYKKKMPTPSELRYVIAAENDKLSAQLPPPTRTRYCSDCQDYGIKESIRGGPLDSIASYCRCERGHHR